MLRLAFQETPQNRDVLLTVVGTSLPFASTSLSGFPGHAVRVSLEDGTVEMHEPHTLMMTRGDVAKTWLKSDGYRLWQLSNVNPETGEPLEMSESRVLMNLCPCLRPPTWRECADPIKTGMRECVPGVLLMLY